MEFFIIREGQQTGPFSEASVQTMLKEGHARAGDMGWRKGLPGWLPLGEIFQPGFSRPSDLPPPMNGAHSGAKQRIITPKQRALLTYLSISWEESMSKEQAALAINDALENPKLTQRFSKWGEEKLRLHEDLFQEEIDYRRANRVVRYTELCQSEAADVVKDITKAHIQVLMESLDKRQPGWEQNSRAALWDYLLPCVNEHFPQLIRTEWKGKLKFGGTPKIAASYTGTPGTDSYVPPADPAPSAMHAAVRGIAFGLCALGLVALGIYVYQPKTPNSEAKNKTAAPAPEPVATPPIPGSPEAVPAPGEVNVATAPLPPDAAPIGAKPAVGAPVAEPVPTPPLPPAGDPAVVAAPPAVPGTPAPAPTENAAPMPNPIGANPAPAPAPAPAFTPAPPPPGAPETPATPPTDNPPAGTPPAGTQPPAPADAPALPAGQVVRNSATLTKPTDAQLQFGKVNLPVGTKLKLIAIEGPNARVNFQNNILLIPIANTDIDPANTIVAPPNAPLPTVAPPPVVPVAPPAPKPVPPKTPSSDL